jgi:hypothetical protein
MSGRLEPLKHEPWTFVTGPLMVLTAVVSVLVFPLLVRQRGGAQRIAALYAAFLIIAILYGTYLGTIFPDATLLQAIPLALVGAHLYGWPVVLVLLLLYGSPVGRLLSTAAESDRNRPSG